MKLAPLSPLEGQCEKPHCDLHCEQWVESREQDWKNSVKWLLKEIDKLPNYCRFGSASGGIMRGTIRGLIKEAFGIKK